MYYDGSCTIMVKNIFFHLIGPPLHQVRLQSVVILTFKNLTLWFHWSFLQWTQRLACFTFILYNTLSVITLKYREWSAPFFFFLEWHCIQIFFYLLYVCNFTDINVTFCFQNAGLSGLTAIILLGTETGKSLDDYAEGILRRSSHAPLILKPEQCLVWLQNKQGMWLWSEYNVFYTENLLFYVSILHLLSVEWQPQFILHNYRDSQQRRL